jgi:hypothetical protein
VAERLGVECCGDHFEVGSEVEWDVIPLQREEWANLEPLGEELLDTITHYTAPDDHIADEERLRAVRARGQVERSTPSTSDRCAGTAGGDAPTGQPSG